jgi:hypothetical protein
MDHEIYAYNNPNGLLIGQEIFFRHISVVDYIEDGDALRRVVMYADKDRQGYAQVIGCVKKAIGTYAPGYRCGEFGEDYEPAHLENVKYVWLYECRKDIERKSFLVQPKDIKMPSDHRVTRSEVLLGKMTEFLVKNMTPWERGVIQKALKAPETNDG